MPRLTKAQRAQRVAIIDEYGALDQELQPLKPKLRRQTQLAEIIRSWHAESPADERASSLGEAFEILLGPREFRTHIPDLAAVYRTLGHEQFLQAAAITLKQLEAHLDAAAIATLTEKTRSGTRPLVVRSL